MTPAKRHASSSILLMVLGATVAVAWVYRGFFLSGTLWIAGDTGDTRGLIGTLEHWLNVARYGVSIRSEPFFYPEKGVMGYNESVLLYVPFYAFFRLLGMDCFVAYECVLISMTVAANAAVHWVLNRGLGFAPWIAFCCSLLFTCSSMTYLVAGHGVLFSVAVLPVILVLATAAARARRPARPRRACLYMALAGILLGMQAATSYYICWAVIFIGGLFLCCLAALLAIFGHDTLRGAARSLAGWWPEISAGALGLALALIPFLCIYLPVYLRLGGHAVEAAYGYMLEWRDFLNVGTGNLLWGKLVRRFCDDGVEMWFGWPPGLILISCWAGWIAFQRLRTAARGGDERERLFCAAIASGVLTWIGSYCLFAKIGPLRLWTLVYRFVPGASGLRVPQRGALITNFFVCLAAAYFLDWVSTRQWTRSLRPGLRGALIGGLALCLLVEQVNTSRTHWLDRPMELAKMHRIRSPLPGCSVFYVSKPAYPGQPTYATQLDAVLTAVRFRLPTVNGRGTVEPEDWNIEDPAEYNYESRANARALRQPLRGDLCQLDLETGEWSRADVLNPVHKSIYRLGSRIDFRTGGDGEPYETFGWSVPEPDGTWMIGRRASLELFLEPPSRQDLLLEMEGIPFSPPGKPRHNLEIAANGTTVSEVRTAAGLMHLAARIDLALLPSNSRLEIAIRGDQDLLSPKAYGSSGDGRHLNFQLRSLRITEASPLEACAVSFQGWYGLEKDRADWWRWTSGRGEVHISVSEDRDLTLSGAVVSVQAPNTIDVVLDGAGQAQLRTPTLAPTPFEGMSLHLRKGEHVLEFVSKNPGVRIPSDTRLLAIALRNLRVQTRGGCRME